MAFYGFPWDATCISRSGTNYGPRGIREVSCQMLTYNARLDASGATVRFVQSMGEAAASRVWYFVTSWRQP